MPNESAGQVCPLCIFSVVKRNFESEEGWLFLDTDRRLRILTPPRYLRINDTLWHLTRFSGCAAKSISIVSTDM